jgi:hypothetical protein
LPVAIYVPHDAVEDAERILESLAAGDLIGEQWSGDREGLHEEPLAAPPPAMRLEAPLAPDVVPRDSVRMEGSSLRLVILLAAAATVYWLFAR